MKILVATGIFPPDIGGPATYSKLLMDELPKRGIGVEVLSFGEVRGLPKVVRHFAYFVKLLLRSSGCDIVFAQDTVSVGFPSLVAARLTRRRFYIRVPGDYAWEQSAQRFGVKDTIDEFQEKRYEWRVEILRSIQRFVVDRSDMAITPSKYFKNLVSKWRRDPSKVKHIYNGIDLKELMFTKEATRKEIGIVADAFVLVSAGRLVPWKGFASLIETVESLRIKGRKCELYILGEGPERTKLETQVSSLGLNDIVHMPGQVPREKLFKYLKAADIFVLNTEFESFSFQIVEAMHCRVPVVSTDTGNIPEIIESGVEGILVEPNNRKALAEAIVKFADDPDFRKSAVERAFKKSESFSIQNTLENLIAYLS